MSVIRPGVSINAGVNISISIGANAGPAAATGAASPCGCKGGDLFSPTAELGLGTPGLSMSPFGPGSGAAALANSVMRPMPDFTRFLNTPHTGFSPSNQAVPAALMAGGMGVPPLAGGGSLTSQALLLQAAASDRNQADLIMAQTGGLSALTGAQGTALAGVNPLMGSMMGAWV